MAILRNQVFPLSITTLSPLHIGTGTRLAVNVDYYTDRESNTTFVVDTNAALDLVVQEWEHNREPYEETLRRRDAEIEQKEAQLQRRREQNIKQIQQFEIAAPRDPVKRQQVEQRLRDEAKHIRALAAQIKESRATPPPPPTAQVLPDILIGNSSLDALVDGGHLPIASLRERAVVDGRPVVRYALSGRPAASDLYELIKDVRDQLYLPGASLKGAFRSALIWDRASTLQPDTFQAILSGGSKAADNRIEERLVLGQVGAVRQRMNNTVRDVLRTFHVGDSVSVRIDPELQAVRIFRSNSATASIAVEAVPTGTHFQSMLQIERYAFENLEARRILDFGDWQQQLRPDALATTCRRRTAALITGELSYYDSFPAAGELSRFYRDLQTRLEQLPTNACLLPIGWGTGWRSKTLDDRLRVGEACEAIFVQAVQRFELKKHKSRQFHAGGSFPDTRKVTLHDDRPWRPLGWVEVTIGEAQ